MYKNLIFLLLMFVGLLFSLNVEALYLFEDFYSIPKGECFIKQSSSEDVEIGCDKKESIVVKFDDLRQRFIGALSLQKNYTPDMAVVNLVQIGQTKNFATLTQINETLINYGLHWHGIFETKVFDEDRLAKALAEQMIAKGRERITSASFEFFILNSYYFQFDSILDFKRIFSSESFEIQKNLLTQEDFFLVMGYNPSFFSAFGDCPETFKSIQGLGLCPQNPVDSISWNEVQSFADFLNRHSKEFHYKLPQVQEWQRVVDFERSDLNWNNSIQARPEQFFWYLKNSEARTRAVRSLSNSPSGISDLFGHLWQWTDNNFCELEGRQKECALKNSFAIVGGGCWNSNECEILKGRVGKDNPLEKSYCIGARLVRFKK